MTETTETLSPWQRLRRGVWNRSFPLRLAAARWRHRLHCWWSPETARLEAELRHWQRYNQAHAEPPMRSQYEFFFTTCFGLTKEFYSGRRVLDLGCGPCGSLEWADNVAARIGLDPLADEYRQRWGTTHQMTYAKGSSDSIPFPDASFDVVGAFDSLYHVLPVLDRAVAEIHRVLKPDGVLLIIIEVGRKTIGEQRGTAQWDFLEPFRRRFVVESEQHYEHTGGTHQSIRDGHAFNHQDPRPRPGSLAARLRPLPA